ncbi:MAG: carbohydrate porin [Gallionella sp.]|nr:carbohydrate porin [Gallionella sp.]
MAADVGGLEVTGYTRGGVFNGTPRGGYTLGGQMQGFRLGNEGDNGFELELRKTFDAGDGMKWSMDYMPTVWNGSFGANQAYAEMTGLDFAPEAKFWAGQRRLRIQDVHIVDHFFMDYGINFGAGMTDYNLGFAKLGVGVFNGGSLDNANSKQNNARRVNVDLSEIQSNPGGVVRVLGTVVSGNYVLGSPGSGIGISHNQSDFLVKGLTNTFFLQTASGHAGLNGQFDSLGDTLNAPFAGDKNGSSKNRIGDSINWQTGKFGGQALVVLQNTKPEGSSINTKDTTIGGRVSYGITRNFKMLAEVGMTSRKPDNSANQTLNKVTIAPTLSLASDFWSRPELRFYVTQASWNDAARLANVGSFGAGGRTSSTTTGAQIEVWW